MERDGVEMRKVMKRIGIAAGIAFLCFAGCLEVDPLVQGIRNGSATAVTNTVYHGWAYSDKPWGSYWTNGGDVEHPLFSVRAKYNWWYALAAVLTFGLYMPMDIEWCYDVGGNGGAK